VRELGLELGSALIGYGSSKTISDPFTNKINGSRSCSGPRILGIELVTRPDLIGSSTKYRSRPDPVTGLFNPLPRYAHRITTGTTSQPTFI